MVKRRCFATLLLAGNLVGQKFPAGPERPVFERVCGSCHPADVVTGMSNTRDGWRNLVNEMFLRGGSATRREKNQIVNYLARSFPLPDRRTSGK